jgi:hypothetical protein
MDRSPFPNGPAILRPDPLALYRPHASRPTKTESVVATPKPRPWVGSKAAVLFRLVHHCLCTGSGNIAARLYLRFRPDLPAAAMPQRPLLPGRRCHRPERQCGESSGGGGGPDGNKIGLLVLSIARNHVENGLEG